MVLLDTNVLSALMRSTPDPVIVEWLDAQPVESIWTSSITEFEVHTGIALLERGRRRRQLERVFAQLLAEDLNGRAQSFDQSAALAASTIAATRQRVGRVVQIRDVQIASIATARRATLATGNTWHFEETGVNLVDPWTT